MQVHVSRYLKYNIEKKTYIDHRAIFQKRVSVVSKCFLIIQMASYNPRLFWYLNHLFNPPAPTGKQWHNSTTKEDSEKKNKKKSVEEAPFSLFLGLSPPLVASFRFASFCNVKMSKMWFAGYFACVYQVAFRYILFRTS